MIKTIHYLSLLLLLALPCSSCDPGKYITANGVCMQCDISCSTCLSSEGCSTCYQQMYLIAQGNQIICQVCFMINKGCDICLTATKCSSCEPGYYLQSDNTCVGCDYYVPNCLICSGNETVSCLSCSSPYHLVNGSCQMGNSPIHQSIPNNPSINAAQNNQPTGGVTCDLSEISLNGICFPSIAFCQTYNQFNGSCIVCIPGFSLSNAYCLPSILIAGNNNTLTPSSIVGGSASLSKSNNAAPSPPISAKPKNTGISGPLNCQIINSADPTQCLVCVSGFTIVDAFPGVCYPLN